MDKRFGLVFLAALISAVKSRDFPYLVEPPPRGSLPGGRLPAPDLFAGRNPLELDCRNPDATKKDWLMNYGKCGISGDPYNGPRHHEEGGAFPKSPVIREYNAGHNIKTKVKNGKNMEGWMEFKLCVREDSTQEVTSQCMDELVLPLADGSGTRFQVTKQMRTVRVEVELPPEVTCNRCVLQWHYRTDLRLGVDGAGTECLDCGGPPLEYYNCADIIVHPTPAPQPGITTEKTDEEVDDDVIEVEDGVKSDVMQRRLQSRGNVKPNDVRYVPENPMADPQSSQTCHAIGKWAKKGGHMDNWCRQKCAYGLGFCPNQICKC